MIDTRRGEGPIPNCSLDIPLASVRPGHDQGGPDISLFYRSIPRVTHCDVGELTRVVQTELAPPLHVVT